MSPDRDAENESDMSASRAAQALHHRTGCIAHVGGSPRRLGFWLRQALGDAGKRITGQRLAVHGGASAVAG